MVGCSAFGCSNQSSKGYLIKAFPRDPKRRKIWTEKVRRKNWIPTNNSRLCEVHFAPEMWERPRVDGKRILKCNAVPTVFNYTKEILTRKKPIKRLLPSVVCQENVFESQSSWLAAKSELDRISDPLISSISLATLSPPAQSLLLQIDLEKQHLQKKLRRCKLNHFKLLQKVRLKRIQIQSLKCQIKKIKC